MEDMVQSEAKVRGVFVFSVCVCALPVPVMLTCHVFLGQSVFVWLFKLLNLAISSMCSQPFVFMEQSTAVRATTLLAS